MFARLGGQGRVVLGGLLGAVVAALVCVIVLTAPDGAEAQDFNVAPQAMNGVSAAGGQLSAAPYAGVAADGAAPPAPATTTTLVPTLTTTPPPVTTTTPPPTTTTTTTHTPPPRIILTFPNGQPIPTFPMHHHCHHGNC